MTVINSGSIGVATTGVLQTQRTPGIVSEPRQNLTVAKTLSKKVIKPKGKK